MRSGRGASTAPTGRATGTDPFLLVPLVVHGAVRQLKARMASGVGPEVRQAILSCGRRLRWQAKDELTGRRDEVFFDETPRCAVLRTSIQSAVARDEISDKVDMPLAAENPDIGNWGTPSISVSARGTSCRDERHLQFGDNPESSHSPHIHVRRSRFRARPETAGGCSPRPRPRGRWRCESGDLGMRGAADLHFHLVPGVAVP